MSAPYPPPQGPVGPYPPYGHQLTPPQPSKHSSKVLPIAGAVLGGLVLLSALAAVGSHGRHAPEAPDGPSAQRSAQSPSQTIEGTGVDVTGKYQTWFRNDVTIRNNDQWRPALNHVTAVEFDEETRDYSILTDISAEDLRHPLPGALSDAGSTVCMSVQLYDSSSGTVVVYGADKKAAYGKTGRYGVCHVTT